MAEELKQLIYNINKSIDEIKKTYKPPKENIIRKEKIQLKVNVLNFFDILLYSNLNNKKSYLEFYKILKDKADPSKIIKQSKKILLSKIFGYDQDYNQILNKSDPFVDYKEILIEPIELSYYSIIVNKLFKTSDNIVYDNIKGNIVRMFYERIGNWKLVAKDKTDLLVENNFHRKNFINECYNNFNKISGFIEIVYEGNIFEDKIDFLDLEKCISIIFLVNSPLQIYYGIFENSIKFNTIGITSKALLNLDPTKTMITIKIDGSFVFFYIPKKSNMIYIWKSGELISRIYKTNPIEADRDIYGCGEFYKKESQKCLYIFYIHSSLKRYDCYIQEIITIFPEYVKSYNELNVMYSKHLGPFQTHEMMYSNMADLMTMQNDLSTDGIIIVETDQKCNGVLTDYKYKTNNTADILCRPDYSVSYKGCYHAIDNKNGETTLAISIAFFANDDNKIMPISKKSVPANNNFNYDENSLCFNIKNNNPTFGPEDLIIPNKSIVEVNIRNYSIERFRIDKTNNYYFKNLSSMYANKTQSQYLGNPYNVVKKIIEFDSTNITYEQIKKLGNEYNISECLNNLQFSKSESFSSILNSEKLEYGYFKSDKDDDYSIRSSIGIFSNFIKTEFIQITQNKLINHKSRVVLDIDAGPLKDSEKHFYAETQSLIATDVDTHAEKKALDVYNTLRERKRNYYPMRFILSSITQPNYVDKIREKIGYVQFNYIYWFFAIHYSWTEENYKIIKDHIKSLLIKEHGKISIITFDGQKIKELLINLPGKEKTFCLENNIKFVVRMTQDNKKIEVSYQNFKSSFEEYLVNIDDMISVMNRSGLVLYDYFNGLELLNRNKQYINIAPDVETNESRNRFISTIKNNISILTEDAELWLSNIIGLTFINK